MSVSTPTLIPRPQLFPRLLPTLPHPPQTYPLAKSHSYPANSSSLWTSGGQSTVDTGGESTETGSSGRSLVGIHGHLNARRNLQREMDDLSEEESEFDELSQAVQQRGFSFLVPIGKTLTVMEEKNDAEEDESEEFASAASNGPPSALEDDGDGENDLDASMEDMDDSMNNDDDDEDNDEIDEENLDEG
ncbi:hypothetical protein DFH05DRAFT_1463651 [Lentinula detonsa]|uniref:Uncharacterized protein n=2 Tax=Lentinula TaxID=5352 RepID=A0AA38NK86_9AGAR|nr:hypothetical protein DFH05DRAFT_1463651 [Lentinula detonsa]KAJ3782703.1 hypothetical protein GGU10DRAFT_378342 [Lentinula aff. detonsa]